MNKIQEIRKNKLFDELAECKLTTIIREFKHFLSFQGEIVNIILFFNNIFYNTMLKITSLRRSRVFHKTRLFKATQWWEYVL